MPDFYAHQVFGAQVFSALPEPVRRLEPQRPGWLCGLYGPDPLFFYHRLAQALPGKPGGPRPPPPGPGPGAGALPYPGGPDHPLCPGLRRGLLCHYILDAVCHPIVNRYSRDNSLQHTLIEGAFDRALPGPPPAMSARRWSCRRTVRSTPPPPWAINTPSRISTAPH